MSPNDYSAIDYSAMCSMSLPGQLQRLGGGLFQAEVTRPRLGHGWDRLWVHYRSLGPGRLLATVAQALPHPSLLLPSTKVPTSSSWTFLESLKEQHKVGAGQGVGGRLELCH